MPPTVHHFLLKWHPDGRAEWDGRDLHAWNQGAKPGETAAGGRSQPQPSSLPKGVDLDQCFATSS